MIGHTYIHTFYHLREVYPIRSARAGVYGSGSGTAVAGTQDVRTHHQVFARVKSFARSYQLYVAFIMNEG